jgi:hypothetical protein
MALDDAALRAHLNMTADDGDEIDTAVLPTFLAASKAHCERILGYALDNEIELPGGVPADIEQAVLMLAAHWYRQRGSVLIGVSGQEVPFGVAETLGEHRSYTFG